MFEATETQCIHNMLLPAQPHPRGEGFQRQERLVINSPQSASCPTLNFTVNSCNIDVFSLDYLLQIKVYYFVNLAAYGLAVCWSVF